MCQWCTIIEKSNIPVFKTKKKTKTNKTNKNKTQKQTKNETKKQNE